MNTTRGNGKDILLQGFHWNLTKTKGTGTIDSREESWYSILKNKVPEISQHGFTLLYLPPPWLDESHWEGNGKHGGGEGYFWHDFDLNSRYGSKEELKSLVASCHSFGIKVIVDIVLNHRDRARMQNNIWPYPGPHWRAGGKESGGAFLDGSCDLRLEHPEVYLSFQKALNELLDECNVDGWRWDFVWGYHPSEVFSLIKDTTKEEYFSVGEYWQASSINDDPMFIRYGGSERHRIVGWAKESGSSVFDMILKRELNTGDPSRFKFGINSSSIREERQMAVTLVDNHDTGASPFSTANGWGQKVWECPAEFKSRAYAFILSMPGTPCVYWPDLYDWGITEIIDLISIRKKAKITSTSEWIDLTDRYTGFAGIVKNELGEETLAISIGSNFHSPGLGWIKALEKKGEWTIWTKE
jgi:alpha-amylase